MWPYSSKPNGVPYIARDGEENPEVDTIPDKKNIGDMSYRVKVLSHLLFYP